MDRFKLIDTDEAKKVGLSHLVGRNTVQVLVEVKADGTYDYIASDGGEPEDQLFCRDWDWVAPLLNRVAKGAV